MRYFLFLMVFWVVGCAESGKPLVVKMHTLRDEDTQRGGDPMARHEKLRRLYGAVSMEERKQRLGQYYTVLWSLPNDVGAKKEVRFEYLQGKTGSLVKTMRRELDSGAAKGMEEFMVIGDNFFENGKVLAWKISLISGGEVVASEQSYMWE